MAPAPRKEAMGERRAREREKKRGKRENLGFSIEKSEHDLNASIDELHPWLILLMLIILL
jgi:hypothetical protein